MPRRRLSSCWYWYWCSCNRYPAAVAEVAPVVELVSAPLELAVRPPPEVAGADGFGGSESSGPHPPMQRTSIRTKLR
ncbi:MAG TPA: hypothetical protein VI197_02405 [Polyangiaceae bacterium]